MKRKEIAMTRKTDGERKTGRQRERNTCECL